MSSDFKSRLIGLAIGIIGISSYFALSHFLGFDPNQHWWAFFICLAILGFAAFLLWNRGSNLPLLRALVGTKPMIVQHADGHLSGKCLRCGQKIFTEPSPKAPSEYKCPSCSLVIRLQSGRPNA